MQQDKVNQRLDEVMNEALEAMKDTSAVEMIAVGTALILLGLRLSPENERPVAWKKLRELLADAEQDPTLITH